jgi:hypothetical protein
MAANGVCKIGVGHRREESFVLCWKEKGAEMTRRTRQWQATNRVWSRVRLILLKPAPVVARCLRWTPFFGQGSPKLSYGGGDLG